MDKIRSLGELNSLKEKFKPGVALREKGADIEKLLPDKTEESVSTDETAAKQAILVCGGTGCKSAQSDQIVENLKIELEKRGMSKDVEVLMTGCFGFCEKGPVVKVLPDNTFYVEVKPEDAEKIVEEHIINSNKVEKLLYVDPDSKEIIYDSENMNFYKKQLRIALRNCGLIDPHNIGDYIARDGYQAIGKVLTEMTPEAVVEEMKKSGLRGRGGGGFPTGLKWEFAAASEADKKYVICNADEGDPGAFMDRSILEGDPHSVVEAMAICGYAIGADEGRVYIRAEYPLAISRLQNAIDSAREYGLLGKNILGSGFDFDIRLNYGAGAFVCGEETALIHSMEGNRGEPTIKPPFPAESGYWGKPTNVNNVETLANIPVIILKGGEWFSKIGTEKSSGTKVFALAGKINNVGLIEVPMGTTLREVIYDIGGGIKNGKKFKAVQTGGPSGGCLTEKDLDTPIDFDNLIAAGSMMGSGGMIVMDEDDCMPSIAKFYLEFTVDESCGKCTSCRVGTKRLHELLEVITSGRGEMKHIEELNRLSRNIKDTALCGLGQTAPNPILSTLDSFYDEYVAHIKDKKCPAAQCTALLQYHIIEDKCIGCTACSRVCPATCITGERKAPHLIDTSKCIKCGACYDKCRFGAIEKI